MLLRTCQKLHSFLFGLSQISIGHRNSRQIQNSIALAAVGLFAGRTGFPVVRKNTLTVLSRTVQAISHVSGRRLVLYTVIETSALMNFEDWSGRLCYLDHHTLPFSHPTGITYGEYTAFLSFRGAVEE